MTENTPTPAELRVIASGLDEKYAGETVRAAKALFQSADALEAVTAERDALAAILPQAHALVASASRMLDDWAESTDEVRMHDLWPPLHENADRLREVLSKLPADALAAHDAQVLREAADDIARRANQPELIERADRWSGYYAGSRAAMQNEESKLRDRADRVEREAQW